ncbi:Cof subfamily protein (haloacid dehalogenase superfamily) [Scopulibacillus daqui]|uniref:Cof subfamily protein (Haloacid dehalogenase superfamily) n=1 Tax=Scopulibacillus daqui TaxID=1469162 RepID=A0ABS2Q061_9BACL|nr:Cof-type HAD-IIB family hydrolase [Scopulibacillus daqui]MBM7645689.1 Cof subfamily protein (haloacid dehalogenase superfamily) [Scopulibacillus daqui]
MQDRKIVFFDIDGTLVDDEKKIPESAVQAVKTLQENGVITAIATGRAPFMFKHIREQLNIQTFVSFNGQYVVHNNEPVFKNPLSKESLFKLEQQAEKNGHPMAFLGSETMAANNSHSFIEKSFNDLKIIPPLEDRMFHHNEEIYQALLFCKQSDKMDYLDMFSDFEYIRWHEYSMDVVPSGGSKAEGIKYLLNKLNIDIKNTYAFGDALNDIEMLSFVPHSFAMGNGVDEAKQAAKYVTKHVQDDGIYYGLQQAGLLNV